MLKKYIHIIVFCLFLNMDVQAYETPFLCAIAEGNTSAVQSFIKQGVAINGTTRDGWAPLHYAAHQARADIVKLLIEAGADVNLEVKVGTPLIACTSGLGNWYAGARKQEFLCIIQELIDNGADVNAQQPIRNPDGTISSYSVPLISAILYPCVASINCHGGVQDTSYAELLIERGADINLVLQGGWHADTVKKFESLMEEKYASQSDADPKFEIKDLNTGECDSSIGYCINDKGLILGAFSIQKRIYFFIQSLSGEKTLINLPPTAEPIRLTNRGHIAGTYLASGKNKRGFFWSSESGFVDLGTLGGRTTIVCDMNESDQIVGQSETLRTSLVDKTLGKHGFIWQKGVMQDVGTLKGELGLPGDTSIAYSIHNNGTIVGSSNTTLCHKGKMFRGSSQAVVRSKNTTEWQAISNGLDQYLVAYAIGNNNEVVLLKKISQNQNNVVLFSLNKNTETAALLSGREIVGAKILNNSFVFLRSLYPGCLCP